MAGQIWAVNGRDLFFAHFLDFFSAFFAWIFGQVSKSLIVSRRMPTIFLTVCVEPLSRAFAALRGQGSVPSDLLMRILVTNDDGARAPGIQHLAKAASVFGTVKIAAPDRERSACGHAMTMHSVLRARRVEGSEFETYEIDGVPVDCVNVGRHVAWPEGCDLLLSGINNGPNLGFDVTYSGTVAGAMEGVIAGIRSIAVSLAPHEHGGVLRFDTAARWLVENWPMLDAWAPAPLEFLNINVPSVPFEEIRGFRWVPLGRRVFENRLELRQDPWGRDYYWQGGTERVCGLDEDCDIAAVSQNFVALTPLSLDWTSASALARARGS